MTESFAALLGLGLRTAGSQERMTTWRDIAVENEDAAKRLVRAGLFRSSVSRAYYAVYAAVTAELVAAGAVPATDADNPSHRALPEMVEGNIPGLSTWERRDLKASARRLYQLRLDADYRARSRIDAASAVQGMSELGNAFRLLKVAEGRP